MFINAALAITLPSPARADRCDDVAKQLANQLDGLSSLTSIPVANLLIILLGMPLFAAVMGWLLAGREPLGMARQPTE